MIISDINYLEEVSETSTIDLSGAGSALAISSFLAQAFGSSSYSFAVVNNQVVIRPSGSSASSSVLAIAASSGGSVLANASSFAAASN